jgi:succinate dehydrogenase/fumarate reductase flavoprotein subunit
VAFALQQGRPHLIRTPGHRYPRHVYGENWIGSDLVFPLKRRAQEAGIRIAEQIFVTRLLTREDRVVGATGVASDGRFVSIQAKAVVIATGGYAHIFLNTNNAPGITGDGLVLAYEAGAALKDMEFIQFYPTAMGRRGSRILLYEKMLAQKGVTLRNEAGQDIIRRHGVSDPMSATRDQLAQLITKEIGNAPGAKQGVVMDLESLSEQTARQLAQLLPAQWHKGQRAFRVSPTAHFCMGGIVTDLKGETCLRGLFAVGEATAGVHGANRLGGNALAEIFSMGSLVGAQAAQRAGETGGAAASQSAIAKEQSRLRQTFSPKGLTPKQLIDDLKELMWRKVGVIRQKAELEEALARLQGAWPSAAAANPAELIRLLEFQNLRLISEMVCRAALTRTESRGAHFREDHPAEDNTRWLKNIVLRKTAAGMAIEASPVRLDLVKPEQ